MEHQNCISQMHAEVADVLDWLVRLRVLLLLELLLPRHQHSALKLHSMTRYVPSTETEIRESGCLQD